MMTEKKFSKTFNSFWRALLPGSDRYLRKMNLSLIRFAPPLGFFSPIEERGVINELGFRLFCRMATDSYDCWKKLQNDVVKQVAVETVEYIKRFRTKESENVVEPSRASFSESGRIANRIYRFLQEKPRWEMRVCQPCFQGCGKVEACEGDVLLAETLYEIKAGDRNFRVIDIRQLLTYCALNYINPAYEIDRVVLLNPRLGLFYEESLDGMCQGLAWTSSGTVLNDIVNFLTETVTSI